MDGKLDTLPTCLSPHNILSTGDADFQGLKDVISAENSFYTSAVFPFIFSPPVFIRMYFWANKIY